MEDNVIDFRGRRARQSPSIRKQARLNARRAAEAEHERQDPLVRAAPGASTEELLQLQIEELAVEAASLRFERMHAAEARVRERLCSRHVRSLRSLANAVIELHREGRSGGLPSGAVLRKVLGELTTEVLSASTEVLDAETAERFAAAVRTRLEPMFERLEGVGSGGSAS